MTWIIVSVLLLVLVAFPRTGFIPHLRTGMSREEITRELANVKRVQADLDAKKGLDGLDGDHYLYRHLPGLP